MDTTAFGKLPFKKRIYLSLLRKRLAFSQAVLLIARRSTSNLARGSVRGPGLRRVRCRRLSVSLLPVGDCRRYKSWCRMYALLRQRPGSRHAHGGAMEGAVSPAPTAVPNELTGLVRI